MKDRSVEERTPRARLNANRGEAGQLTRLKSAALLVRVGLDHEPWLRRALARLGDGAPAPGGPRGLDLSRSITLLQTETPRLRADAAPHQHGFGNPHDWLDPENARPMTVAIASALARLAPAERGRFEENRRRFVERLDAGLRRWRAALAPYRGARLVTMHDWWPYFAARLGLLMVATVEPTPRVIPSIASGSASSWPGAASWSPATAWCCARCARRRESVSATG